MPYFPELKSIIEAKHVLNTLFDSTPLVLNKNLSSTFNSNIYLKREDLQEVRSYKIRGAYNKISTLTKDLREKGIVCASAGNHAQGVAFSCHKLGIYGKIFMPNTTPKQKIKQVSMFGKEYVEIILHGDTYDDAYHMAISVCNEQKMTFIHPFDDEKIIEGQATVGLEILQEIKQTIDYIFIPIGGGGLSAGVGSYIKQMSPDTKIIGVEPAGAASMFEAIKQKKIVKLEKIDKFVDGAAVQQVGTLPFEICQKVLDDIVCVPEGKICTKILELYNYDAIVVEPAGALSIAALDYYKDKITGKNVVCILSGSNNDITRTEEIKERSLLYEGLKHYFMVQFPQRAGALKDFVEKVLGPHDDITRFEYNKKTSRQRGPALVAIEITDPKDLNGLIERIEKGGFEYEYINDKPTLFEYIV